MLCQDIVPCAMNVVSSHRNSIRELLIRPYSKFPYKRLLYVSSYGRRATAPATANNPFSRLEDFVQGGFSSITHRCVKDSSQGFIIIAVMNFDGSRVTAL